MFSAALTHEDSPISVPMISPSTKAIAKPVTRAVRLDRICGAHLMHLAQTVPEVFLELDEFRHPLHLFRVARAFEIDVQHLFDAPRAVRHENHTVGEQDGLFHVMDHKDNAVLILLPDVQELFLHIATGLLIQRAKGLIHQHDRRRHHQSAREADTLLHTTGELFGIFVLDPSQPDERNRFARLFHTLRLADAAHL